MKLLFKFLIFFIIFFFISYSSLIAKELNESYLVEVGGIDIGKLFWVIEINKKNYKISIEAGRSDTWVKFIGQNGMSFGVNDFGKSAPYKEIFKDFKLTVKDISNKTKKMIKKIKFNDN